MNTTTESHKKKWPLPHQLHERMGAIVRKAVHGFLSIARLVVVVRVRRARRTLGARASLLQRSHKGAGAEEGDGAGCAGGASNVASAWRAHTAPEPHRGGAPLRVRVGVLQTAQQLRENEWFTAHIYGI